jgi:integrase
MHLPPTTFQDQAAWWIDEMSEGQILHAKKREPIDPNTINSYQNAVAYLNDKIGKMPIASIDNPQARAVIAKMKAERRKDGLRRFSDKTIVEYFQVLRRVVSSVLDENFNPIHHRSWNLAAIGLPRVNPKKQRRPTLTAKEMTTLLSKAEGQYPILYFFCIVTGMRVSEVVAIEIDKHIESDCSIVYVRQQREKSKNCVKPHLKTESGCRDVDIHPDAAAILRNFIGDRKSGYLFQTADGRMFDPRSIARANLEPLLETMGRGEAGTMFNVFRRFREAVLQRSDVRQILIDYWMGHSNASIGDRYGKQLVEDIEYRQEQVKKVGLGFELPPCLFGLRGLQIVENVEAA